MSLLQVPDGLSALVLILILVIALALYFLPALLARNKNAGGTIFFLNLFFGWTFIVWIILLIWSTSQDENSIVTYDNDPLSKIDEINEFKQLLDSGAINHEEYEKEKRRILNS
jgi:hypothetical protein